MSARDDFDDGSAITDRFARMCDEIDRLRGWQRETIRWQCEKRLLVEINGGELVPCDEIYTPEGLDVIRAQQTNEIVRLRAEVDRLTRLVTDEEAGE